MKKLNKKVLSCSLISTLMLTSPAIVYTLNSVQVVHAASKALNDAKARMDHLNWSLHKNYLGIKNQGQWEAYIKGIRDVIKKIPSSESSERDKLTTKVNKAETLVKALSRINQVEKSMEVNTLRMGNVRVWDNYLTLGKQDLEKVDKSEFLKEITELKNRLGVCEEKISGIVNNYNDMFDKVHSLYKNADELKDVEEAKKALEEAKKLSKCEESDTLVYKCTLLLADLGEITLNKDETSLRSAYYVFQEILDLGGFDVMNTLPSTIEDEVKSQVGNGVQVKATKVISNPDTGEEVFDIVLYKGEAKLYPISVVFN